MNGYQRNTAPATLLKSASGSPHINISSAQRTRRVLPGGWGNNIETRVSYQLQRND
ncbi:hypothetical protein ACLQUA_000798 [Enterobacter ludwigii]|uniref:hypothetical protein n=1 Tax=Enterobacter TaxID=547 RepID=UPI001ED98C56|nr:MULTISPECIES: hypothetical protein [Enterobacter]MDF9915829.1 hypothetical protein [Enterobacter ludwigii]MDP5159591.1 hypothetical protein [Enterobacter ludwigii]MDV8142148.1 hypothetical protein [Enterobacter ludwigii]WGC27159.1 hypothetical protein NFL62_13175 [Enterobacter ludwigii]WNJ02898.1 hypothetical protein RIK67_12410 [Enterobacter ludwigii]